MIPHIHNTHSTLTVHIKEKGKLNNKTKSTHSSPHFVISYHSIARLNRSEEEKKNKKRI